jgi:hypothetical protein
VHGSSSYHLSCLSWLFAARMNDQEQNYSLIDKEAELTQRHKSQLGEAFMVETLNKHPDSESGCSTF